MSIEDCITVYKTFSEKAFKNRNNISPVKAFKAATGRPWFDANVLEKAVRDLLFSRGMDADMLLKEDFDPTCKV
jgi:hypothetical protein